MGQPSHPSSHPSSHQSSHRASRSRQQQIQGDLERAERTPRPVVAVGRDYPPSFELARHRHRRSQLIYAAAGVVTVATDAGAWVAPPERAVWIPAGVAHAVKMVGAVSTRSVLVDADACRGRGDRCQVLIVSSLLRALLLAATEVPRRYDRDGRDGLVMALLVAEILQAPIVPLAVPFPRSATLARRCHAFLARPHAKVGIDDFRAPLGVSRRAFTRSFRRETGLSFAAWRTQACLVAALPRLAAGERVTSVAVDLGYDSPAAFATMFKRLLRIAPSRYQPASP
jgi:AraC-like DNA-binding protein/quercetin dioxygenase-like cupin family protein